MWYSHYEWVNLAKHCIKQMHKNTQSIQGVSCWARSEPGVTEKQIFTQRYCKMSSNLCSQDETKWTAHTVIDSKKDGSLTFLRGIQKIKCVYLLRLASYKSNGWVYWICLESRKFVHFTLQMWLQTAWDQGDQLWDDFIHISSWTMLFCKTSFWVKNASIFYIELSVSFSLTVLWRDSLNPALDVRSHRACKKSLFGF